MNSESLVDQSIKFSNILSKHIAIITVGHFRNFDQTMSDVQQ